MAGKTLGLKSATKFIIKALENCDTSYPIVPSFTFDMANLDQMILSTDSKYQKIMMEKDNIDPAIASHWGTKRFWIYLCGKGIQHIKNGRRNARFFYTILRLFITNHYFFKCENG